MPCPFGVTSPLYVYVDWISRVVGRSSYGMVFRNIDDSPRGWEYPIAARQTIFCTVQGGRFLWGEHVLNIP